jgi:hypothetical protein
MVPTYRTLDEFMRYREVDSTWQPVDHRSFRLTGAGVKRVSGYRSDGVKVDFPSTFLYVTLREIIVESGSVSKEARRLFSLLRKDNTEDWFPNLRFITTDSDFQLVVFLIELKALKGSLRNIKQMLKTFRKLWKRSKIQKRSLPATLGDLLSAGWLEWSYGLGAFLRDLVKLWKIFSKWNSDLESFVGGMGVTKHTRFSQTKFDLVSLPDEIQTLSLFGLEVRVKANYSIPSVHAREPYGSLSAAYRYYSSVLTQAFGYTRWAMQRLGVVPDPSIIWQLIPLSFVIDWVIPVEKWLSKHRVDLVDLRTVIDGVGFGNRLTLKRQYSFQTGIPGPYWTSFADEQWRLYSRIFYREDKLPTKLDVGKFTLTRKLSASALIWQLILKDRVK